MSEQVNHPKHYNSGKIEVIEFLEDQKLGPHEFNVVKYVARAGKKDPSKQIEDLEKGLWYLKRKIELLKAEKEGRDPLRPNAMNPNSVTPAATSSRGLDRSEYVTSASLRSGSPGHKCTDSDCKWRYTPGYRG